MRCCVVISCLLLIAACGEGSVRVPSGKPKNKPADAANEAAETYFKSGDPLIDQLRKDAAEVALRKEHQVDEIEVQHLLIGHASSMPHKTQRSVEDAEKLTADLYNRIKAGADFDSLVKEFTDDQHPGKYPMTQQSRKGMVAAFGNVGWRLNVGEVGVAQYHYRDSQHGWHIIKRLR